MANAVSITIIVNTKPARAGVTIGKWMMEYGFPDLVAYWAIKSLAWIRVSTERDWPWQGWRWIGGEFRLSRNG